MEAEKDVEKVRMLNNKQVISLLAGAIFTTFSLTTIYNKFIFNDEEIKNNTISLETLKTNVSEIEVNKASNERLDKKTKRIEERVAILEEEIKRLKEPNSDKSK